MICVHKLKGEEVWINPDLIAFVEGRHETRLTFLDGHHVIVSDPPAAIAEAVRTHRAQVLALAFLIHAGERDAQGDVPRHLQPVPPIGR